MIPLPDRIVISKMVVIHRFSREISVNFIRTTRIEIKKFLKQKYYSYDAKEKKTQDVLDKCNKDVFP